MPRLVYLVRDSQIDCKDKQGNQMSENQYLELRLSEIAKSGSRKIAHTRDKILKMFPDRELVAIRHPLGPEEQDDPGDLQSLALGDLSPEFTSDAHFLRSKIINDTPIKQIWSRTITGHTLAFLLTEYV